MCGRFCLTLDPDQVLCACKYKTTSSKPTLATPEWRAEFNLGRTFTPSYNIAPTDITPALVSGAHFNGDSETRIIVPMMWSMKYDPAWDKESNRKHKLTTNNCRLENMLNSRLYSGPFRRGQRCVIPCEGFYEWQTTKPAKPSERAVHFIFVPQNEGLKIYDNTTWSSPENVNLLMMAGLFDVWTNENGDKIYSYSVITFESSEIMSWMHHRMPAILETEQQISDWLDFKRVTDAEALATLRPAENLEWYQVSNIVNNSRNKTDECNKPYNLAEAKKKQTGDEGTKTKNKTLLSWLTVRKRDEVSDKSDCRKNDSETTNPPKRPKKFPDNKEEGNN